MNGNFCPHCGKKVKPGTKFCPSCGYHFVQQAVKPVQVQATQPLQMPAQPTQVANQVKPTKKKKYPWIFFAFAVVVLLAAGGFCFYHFQMQKSASGNRSGLNYQQAKGGSLKPMKQLSSKEWASLVITYAHQKYPNNSDWSSAYQDVKDGKANIEKSDQFGTSQGTIAANNDQILYIVNDKVAFIMPTSASSSEQEIVLADSQKTLGQPTTNAVYKAVDADGNAAKEVAPMARQITFYQNNTANQGDERDGFTDLQCAVMAYVYKDSSDAEGQIDRQIDACTDYDADDAWNTIPTGIGRYPNGGDNAYAISEGVESKKFWVFKFDPDGNDIDITCHHNGKTTFHMTGNRSALIKRYGDYEDEINTLIKKINYNANHLDELRDKIDDDD